MSDNKEIYSEASKYYVENNSGETGEDKNRYDKSKEREVKHNADWMKQKVNLNEVIDTFTPDCDAVQSGPKMRFISDDYEIVADMASGYLRVYDKRQGCYVRLDGTRGNNKETHFKIKRREEM